MSSGLFRTHRVLWMRVVFGWRPASDSVLHCCDDMDRALEHACEQHPAPWDCPDTALVYHEPFNEYGIPIRGCGMSYLLSDHCPGAAQALPNRIATAGSRRSRPRVSTRTIWTTAREVLFRYVANALCRLSLASQRKACLESLIAHHFFARTGKFFRG